MNDLTGRAEAFDDGLEALDADPRRWEVLSVPSGTRTTTVPNAPGPAPALRWAPAEPAPLGLAR
jgi:hypothetical protein